MMKRNMTLALALLLVFSLALPVQSGRAVEILDEQILPVVQVDPEYADEYQLVYAALQAHTPGAVVDYAVRERDDGRYEWDLFITLNGQIGQAEIDEATCQVRRVMLYDLPVDGLSAADVMAMLVQAKGELVVLDLELDRDDGRLGYEGEAVQKGKRYEFEVSMNGSIIEWDRD